MWVGTRLLKSCLWVNILKSGGVPALSSSPRLMLLFLPPTFMVRRCFFVTRNCSYKWWPPHLLKIWDGSTVIHWLILKEVGNNNAVCRRLMNLDLCNDFTLEHLVNFISLNQDRIWDTLNLALLPMQSVLIKLERELVWTSALSSSHHLDALIILITYQVQQSSLIICSF